MGQEDQPAAQPSPAAKQSEDRLAKDLAMLSARVEALERELAELRSLPPKNYSNRPRTLPLESDRNGGIIQNPPLHAEPENQAPLESRPLGATAASGAQAQVAKTSLENRIGSQFFSRVGIVALLIGATWFLKLAMDNHWIGSLGRIVIGLIAGAGLVLWSERFRRQGFHAFSWSLKAIGSGVLYLSLWAAFQLYHLLPASIALAAMILVTGWNAFMAWSQDNEILAAYALAGGLATPLLLSTGGNHEIFLFTYLLAIDIATVSLIRLKPWPGLLLGAFPATVAYYIGWYIAFSSADQLGITVLFVALFFSVFASVPVGWKQPEPPAVENGAAAFRITEIFLPLGNAIFGSLALYSLLQAAGHHNLLPWLMVLFAVVYLGLMRLPQTAVASAVHLSLAIVFLTIAIPLKASGRWITIGWLAEAIALLWVSSRLDLSAKAPAELSAHRILRWLAVAALALGFCALLVQPFWFGKPVETAFFNARFATALFGVAVFAACAWLSLQTRRTEGQTEPAWPLIAGASTIALNLVAIIACVRELNTFWSQAVNHQQAELQRSLAVSAFLMIYGAVLLAVGFWKRTAFIRWQALLLLVFTIAKTFVYDMRNLSQGYRVVSFLGLGALLMAISFAYQKDWLSLRGPEPDSDAEKGAEQ